MCNVMFKASRYAAADLMQVWDGDMQRWRAWEVHHRTGDILLAEKEESNDAYTCAIF
jgi:hypothetical protein